MPDNKSVPRNLTYAKVYQYAFEMFGYDKDKTNIWWMNKIEQFDNMSPFEMVKAGKGRMLMKFIARSL